MYITHLAALWLLLFPVPTTYTPSRLSKRLRHTQGHDTDTHGGTCIGSRSFARLYLALARVYVRVGRKKVMTALAWLYIYMCMYTGVCLSLHLHIYTYIYIFLYIHIAHSRPP